MQKLQYFSLAPCCQIYEVTDKVFIFYLSFEISKNIQKIKNVRLETSSIQRFNYLTLFRHVSLIKIFLVIFLD